MFVIEAGPHGRNGWVKKVEVRMMTHWTVCFDISEAYQFSSWSEAHKVAYSLPIHWDATVVEMQNPPGPNL